jgi:hypothetical protein
MSAAVTQQVVEILDRTDRYRPFRWHIGGRDQQRTYQYSQDTERITAQSPNMATQMKPINQPTRTLAHRRHDRYPARLIGVLLH